MKKKKGGVGGQKYILMLLFLGGKKTPQKNPLWALPEKDLHGLIVNHNAT